MKSQENHIQKIMITEEGNKRKRQDWKLLLGLVGGVIASWRF